MAEKITIMLYIISHTVLALYMMFNRKYAGEAKGINTLMVDNLSIFTLLLVTILGYIILYWFYKKTRLKKPCFKFLLLNLELNIRKMHYFFFILVVAQLLFFIYTGVGRVYGSATSSISFIFSFLSVDSLFLFYYVLGREKRKIYLLNILLFSALELMRGWTGFILDILVIEMYFYFKNRKKNILDPILISTIPTALILFGGKIYQYVFQFKNYIRYNSWFLKIDYIEGLVQLTSRLSFFPLSVSVFQNFRIIKELYLAENIFLKDIQAMFRPLLPRFIMPFKEFRTLNNAFKQAIYYDITNKTSANVGFIGYTFQLFYTEFFTGVVWLFLMTMMFLIISSIIRSAEQYKGQLNILYFLLLINIYQIATLETVYSYGYIRLFYLIPFMFLFKIIRVRKREGSS